MGVWVFTSVGVSPPGFLCLAISPIFLIGFGLSDLITLLTSLEDSAFVQNSRHDVCFADLIALLNLYKVAVYSSLLRVDLYFFFDRFLTSVLRADSSPFHQGFGFLFSAALSGHAVSVMHVDTLSWNHSAHSSRLDPSSFMRGMLFVSRCSLKLFQSAFRTFLYVGLSGLYFPMEKLMYLWSENDSLVSTSQSLRVSFVSAMDISNGYVNNTFCSDCFEGRDISLVLKTLRFF